MSTLQAVIFDYGGVLRADGREGWDAIDEPHRLPRGALWSAYHDIPEYPPARRGEIDADAFRAGVRRRLAEVAGDQAQGDAALAALDRYMEALPPIDAEMRALVVRLRAAGKVKLGLLSNANRGWTERLRSRCGDLFDDVVVSGDVGLAKPDPEVFRLAARRLGVEPAACLMIDDQPQHLESARRVGLRTHLFEHSRVAELVTLFDAEGVLGD
jgi:epoxide hydrolase-like predicted phosphatase